MCLPPAWHAPGKHSSDTGLVYLKPVLNYTKKPSRTFEHLQSRTFEFFEIFLNEKQARTTASPAKSVSQVWI